MSELILFPAPLEEPSGPSDQTARRRALDVRLSAIVEAPAGSGKTGLLLQRFLRLLAEGGVEAPEEVLAITFTRKATTELRDRVLEQLYDADAGKELPPDASAFQIETRALAEAALAVDARLGWKLLEQPQRLRIRTIDALCAEIARTLPLLSGSGTTGPVDSAEPLYREAARRTLLELGGSNNALNEAIETVLLHRDGNLIDCEKLLARMLEHRQQWGELVPLAATEISEENLESLVRPRLERSLREIVTAGLRRVQEVVPERELEELAELAARLAHEPSYQPNGSSPIAFCRQRPQAPSAEPEDLQHWVSLLHLLFTKEGGWRRTFRPHVLGFNISYADGGQLKDIVDRMQSDATAEALQAINDLPPIRFPDDQWRVAKALFRLLRQALAHLKIVFAEKGRCDFAELALAACDALSAEGSADLASSPGARLKHLLVDEMQDTSSSQYTLLERLTRSWDGHSQTVFLVGDPKQSIYLFRQARVERFLRTAAHRRLGDVPLEALQLTANFRSQRDLVEAINGTFEQVFATGPVGKPGFREELNVPFVRAEAARPLPAHPETVEWHTEVLQRSSGAGDRRLTSAEVRHARARDESKEIRRIIETWKARPLPAGRTKPWSIAVLARARNHLTSITAELSRDYGTGPIPFRAVQIDTLDETPEVLDAFALTRALIHPADRTAWLAVLRAPWCGLSLADLLRLTGEGPEGDREATVAELVQERRSLISPEGQELLARAWPVLEQAVATLGRNSLASHVQRTWLCLGGDAPLMPDRITNVRKFFEALREVEEESAGPLDLTALSARLSNLFAEASRDENAVQLLTIHNSKGLEFDVVLIPSLERGTNRSRPELLNWLELDPHDEDAAHILLAPIASRGEQSDGLNQWLGRFKRSRENAELRRLLYVACTRARESLHLFASCDTQKDGTLRLPPEGTLLRAAWPVAQGYFNSHPFTQQEPPAFASSANAGKLLPFAGPPVLEIGLDLAASSADAEPTEALRFVRRLPAGFDPLARFTSAPPQLPYLPASALPHAPGFERPEGSFLVRAFGNVVHRFLQALCTELSPAASGEAALLEIRNWEPRLFAALRSEGLAPAVARREVSRALTALTNAIQDPVGRWILSSHPSATSERSVASFDSSVLRADRTFLAGERPLVNGTDRIWVIDFKTTEQGSHSPEQFERDQIRKYREQLERYAEVVRELAGNRPIVLGLYYPLLPRLLHWNA